ncbi:toll-like receptor 9 [Antennarius striatus]|uniref:toll-like receptor 9 n=1 Tax=Antennarius striatus TaxID=241820 RepID=UPI0035B42BDE
MASLRNIVLLCQLLPFVRMMNMTFFPCYTDVNTTTVDCSYLPLRHVPNIESTTVLSLNLSLTKIQRVGEQDLSGFPNLHTLKMTGNCQPGRLRPLDNLSCKMEIHYNAFKDLINLQFVNLSGNSLTSIPWLPESLRVLDLQNNCIFQIIHPLGTPYLEELYLTKNCFYVNPCKQSLYISKEVFKELTKIKIITLGYDNLTAIPEGLPPSLESLDLRENTITEVKNGAFVGLTNLKQLNLEWNCQRCDHAARPCFPCPNNLPLQLHRDSFYTENSSLSYLNLRGNSLRTFPEGMFQPLKNLHSLDLSDNLLAYAIQNGTFFAELKGLTWMNLIYNYEPLKTFKELNLSPDVSSMVGLQCLLLSGNFFRTLSNESLEILSKLKNLKKLELRMNFMTSCNVKALNEIPSLIDIDFSQNMLNFHPHCSSLSSVIDTQECSQNQKLCPNYEPDPPVVKNNQKFTFESDVWDPNQLSSLKMWQKSGFKSSSDWYDFCDNKMTYDLSQNDITSLNKEVFVGMENVICLDLSFNYISQALRGGEFDDLKNLVYLNMSYNRLDFYYREAFSELNTTLKLLDLSNNDFHFKMSGMGHGFKFIENLISLEILSLANNGIGMRITERLISSSLKYFYFNGNHLGIMWQSDNNKYTNFFHNLTNLIFLDISNNELQSISVEQLSNLPRTIEILIISHNLLKYFPWQNIYALSNLRHLDISQNFIRFLPLEVIEFGSSFSVLDLSHNLVSFIPKFFFSQAKSLQYLYLSHNQIKELNLQFLPAPLRNGSALVKLTLHKNPFKCDCDTSWFADFLRNTPIEIPHLTTDIQCEFPESQEGKSILTMDQRSCRDIYGYLSSLICSFLVVACTVLPLMKHLYGWDLWYSLQILWAGHKGYSQLTGSDSQYHYDAFVVFDTSNPAVRDWIYNELTINLEDSGHRRFCLCLEERDWIPGLSCIENLHNAVYSSVKTVFVLSSGTGGRETINGMIRQAFFMVQQRLLDEKVDAAVLVLLDEVFPRMNYVQLRKRLCRKSVLSWPKNPKAQPLFWNRVKMALSSDNLSFYDNNMSEGFI